MFGTRRVGFSVVGAVLCALLASVVGGCASGQGGSESASESPDTVRVNLLVVAVDGDRFAESADARWLQSFLGNEARDVDIARSETSDLLGEARRRLRGAPGYEFMRTPSLLVETGSRAMVSESAGAGAEMQIAIRPRKVGDGLYEVSPSVAMLHNQSSGDGIIGGVSYRAPALRYGTVPLTVPAGGARAVRMRKEVGTSIRPANLVFFVFAEVTPAK